MSSQLAAEMVWRDQAKDILELLQISDSSLLDDTVQLWKRIALRLRITPMDSEVENAQACIEQAGGSWDEEYVVNGELVSYVVYGEFSSLLLILSSEELQDLLRGQFQPELPLDEDEEAGGDLTHKNSDRNVGDLVNKWPHPA